MRFWHQKGRLALLAGLAGLSLATLTWVTTARAQSNGGTISLKADVQEANALTGVITARGNVQVEYPSRDIYATSAQAQYFSQERRIILSGDVVVNQEGNQIEAETVTYLIDEGRFVALPQPNRQVQSTYLVPESVEPTPGSASGAAGGGRTVPLPDPDGTLQISPITPADNP
jgi:lipopolysaccharide export system protein LptA